MEIPQIKGYEILAEIGTGATGTVFKAKHDDGMLCAVKVFDSMSSNPALIGNRVNRLIEGGAQDVTVPITAQALEMRPACVVMPFMAEVLDEGGIRPRTLQNHYEEFALSEKTWPFILKLASRLAAMHTAKVAHGNLKPGNIFIGSNGGPLPADYASGLMPGVHRLTYSDSLLYSPPEQLRDPAGYDEEAGYRWDVYAFGVLAFRLLTGIFPRCDETFQTVSPAPGGEQRFDIEADHEGIAKSLDDYGDFSWPDEPADEEEARRREMIGFCLALDPSGRPGDMREVSRFFLRVESEVLAEDKNRKLVFEKEQAEKKRAAAAKKFKIASMVALGLSVGWAGTQGFWMFRSGQAAEEFSNYKQTSNGKIEGLITERYEAAESEKTALEKQTEIQLALDSEQAKAKGELLSAQLTNDALFDWILEKGVVGLPVLQDRPARLEFLGKKIDEQLKGLIDRPGLEAQAAMLRLRRAELYLAAGNEVQGRRALEKALADESLQLPVATAAKLRWLLLVSKTDKLPPESAIADVEKSIRKAWPNDESRRVRANAALELIKGRSFEKQGDEKNALTAYTSSLRNFRKLFELHPETPAVALTLGRAYLSAARAAEGEGSLENAARLRSDAADAFQALAAKEKNPPPELEYQIASATAAKAVSLWQQGSTFEAEELARKGVAKLTALQLKMPDDFRLSVDLAGQQGIIATALRDEGRPKEARALLNAGIKSLTEGLKAEPKNWNARYLLASLKWQLSGLLGQQGESESELKIGIEAREELALMLKSGIKSPNPSAIRKSLAYLCGDLGHSADLKDKRELAIQFLKESQRYWQELVRDEGDQMEFREGYHWAAGRLSEMGAK